MMVNVDVDDLEVRSGRYSERKEVRSVGEAYSKLKPETNRVLECEVALVVGMP